MKILRTTDRNFRYDFGKVYKDRMLFPDTVEKTVATVLDDIRRMGDQSLFKYTEQFDNFVVSTKNIEVSKKEIAAAVKKVDKKDIKAIENAARRIEDFSKQGILKSWQNTKDGITLGFNYRPIERVGIYVPGGKAAYPSSVLMTAVPARVAGVSEIIMVSPWPRGEVNPAVLAAAKIAGVDRIFKVGGAQAVGALAYGTKSVPKVDKIVGPGNIYVTLAKKRVYGDVDIDMIAGPSEICVLADGSVPAQYIAADLLAQAEHDELACPLLITDDSNFASRVDGEVRIQLASLRRKDIANASIQKRALIVLVRNLNDGIDLVNEIAPEHLELAVKDPKKILDKIINAGAVFMGAYTPETMGDYLAGPSHVLPTAGTARYFSPLNTNSFIKATSVISLDKNAFNKLAPDAIRLAEMEGLDAHAKAVSIRLK
ncbi:histidinol dehydrogenase [bacterium]|nr:histidinol dehydrogenase [bacterium]